MSDFLGDLLRIGKKIIDASEAFQAEIDKHSPPPGTPRAQSSTASASDSVAAARREELHYPEGYAKHVLAGCPDPLDLLTVDEAERLMGCVIATPSTIYEEEYIGRHYGCADDRSMYVALTVSALMPWDFITSEVTSTPALQQVGDEALVAGDHLYVRKGERFFWLYGRGVAEDVIYQIAHHVAAKIGQ